MSGIDRRILLLTGFPAEFVLSPDWTVALFFVTSSALGRLPCLRPILSPPKPDNHVGLREPPSIVDRLRERICPLQDTSIFVILCLANTLLGFRINDLRSTPRSQLSATTWRCLHPSCPSGAPWSVCFALVAAFCSKNSFCNNNLPCSSVGTHGPNWMLLTNYFGRCPANLARVEEFADCRYARDNQNMK